MVKSACCMALNSGTTSLLMSWEEPVILVLGVGQRQEDEWGLLPGVVIELQVLGEILSERT